jgi:glucokinase
MVVPVHLVGDIGGTHTRLSLVDPTGRTVRRQDLESRRFPSLEEAVRTFLDTERRSPKVRVAVFGVAGVVVRGRVKATNLPWIVDAKVLARRLSIKRVTLLNDLVALALGTLSVSSRKLHVLGSAGSPRRKNANLAVLGAGTGLGEAMLVWHEGRYVPSATEGGHTDFAPRDELEIELLRFLRARFGHVSWERILSGNGLSNLYDFFCQRQGFVESPENIRAIAAAPDRNAAISELGISEQSQAASHAIELFATIYGAEAGNLALKTLALGGVYVTGAIASRLLPVLDRGGFRRAFADKGRFVPLMETIPVAVVLDPDIGLAGAARVALGV